MSDGQESNSLPWWVGQEQQGEQDLRRRALDVVLAIVLAAGTVVIAASLFREPGDPVSGSPSRSAWTETVPVLAAYLLILALIVLRRLDFRLRAAGLLLLGYGAGIYFLATQGLVGSGTLVLLTLPALGLLFLGGRAGTVMAGISLFLYAAFALLAAGGWLAAWHTAGGGDPSLGRWVGHGLLFLMLLCILVGLQAFLGRAQARALALERQKAEALAVANRELEQGGQQLDRRVRLLEATVTITRDLAACRDAQELLERAVALAVERLDFDGAAVYLVDDGQGGATGAGPGEAGSPPATGGRQVWLAASHGTAGSAPTGGLQGKGGPARVPAVVGHALARKRLAVDATPAGGPPGYDLAIPLVPEPAGALSAETGARVVEPEGRASGRITGVLLLHSPAARQAGEQAFPAALNLAHLVPIVQAVAGQLAASLEHLRLLSETSSSLRELEARYRHYAGEAWQAPGGPAGEQQPARSWQAPGAPAGEQGSVDWEPIFAEARATGEPVVHLDGEQGAYLVAVPVKLRDVPIGAIGFHRDAAAGPWLPEQVASVQAVAERVALAAENLRLLGATQRRAAYDRLLAEVTARMRQSLDVDTLLQAGVREMRQALGIPEVELWLDLPDARVPAEREGEVEG